MDYRLTLYCKDEQNRKYFLQSSKFHLLGLCLVFPNGSAPIRAAGAVEGEILFAERGENGFGYDPLFWYDPMGKTLAEMTPDEKNAISHRGAAVRQFAARFARRMGLVEDTF